MIVATRSGSAVRFRELLLRDPALLEHQPKHEIAARGRGFGRAVGREPVRALDHACEQRALGERQVAHGLAEVEARGLADAVNPGRAALPEVDLVEVGLEDRVLLVPGLDDEGHRSLFHLALQAALGRQEEVLHQLLRERAAALHEAARAQVRGERAADAPEIEADVRVEALILDRQDCVRQLPRDFGNANKLALFAIGPVVGADLLGLEEQRTDLALRLEVADAVDHRARELERDEARRLRAARVLEGAAVDPQLVLAHAVTAERERFAARLAVAEPLERPAQVDQRVVEAGVEDQRRGQHARRDAEERALEARPHDAIEVRELAADDAAHC